MSIRNRLQKITQRAIGIVPDPPANGQADQSVDNVMPSISVEKILTIPMVWAALREISEAIASLQTVIVDKNDPDNTPIEDHPMLSVLEGNSIMSQYVLRQKQVMDLLIHGNSYNEILLTTFFAPVAVFPFDNERVSRVFTVTINGQPMKRFDVKNPDSTEATYDESQILHIVGVSTNGLVGDSPAVRFGRLFNTILMAESSHLAWFRRGGRPISALTPAPTSALLEDAQKKALRDSFKTALTNEVGVVVLPDGYTSSELGSQSDETVRLLSLRWLVTQVSRVWGVPIDKLASLEGATFSNVEEQNKNWVRESIEPLVSKIDDAYTRNFLQAFPDLQYYTSVEPLLSPAERDEAAEIDEEEPAQDEQSNENVPADDFIAQLMNG